MADVKEIRLPHFIIPYIIGRGGRTLRQIMAKSEASVDIQSDVEAGDATFKVVTIQASSEGIKLAEKYILKIIHEVATRTPLERLSRYDDPYDQTPDRDLDDFPDATEGLVINHEALHGYAEIGWAARTREQVLTELQNERRVALQQQQAPPPPPPVQRQASSSGRFGRSQGPRRS